VNNDLASGLQSALAHAMPGVERIESVRRLSGGASQETWSFDAVVNGRNEPLILRRASAARVEGSSTSVPLETEAEAIETARAAGVAAPRVRYVLAQEDGLGRGYVMDRLRGETIARKILRDADFDAMRPLLARQCGEILARIHRVDTTPLQGALNVMDGPAQLARYRDLYDSYDYPHPVFEFAFKWLEPRIRPAARPSLVHGDFRHGNLLISPDGVEAVLDWELVHIGDPLEDIGWICTNSWRFGAREKVVGGFGDLADLLSGYADAGGAPIDPEDVRSWIAFGSLKWGIMCMTMYQGFLRDRSVERAAIGRRCSETEIDLVNLIMHGRL
jgi:aminoglycoside phosphotransferase (APT) family kinase protein